MHNKRFLLASLFVGGVCGGTTIVSCSSSDDSAINIGDSGADVQQKDANTVDADDDAGSICSPTLPTGWPTWTPPNPIDTTACTTAQVQQFYDTCNASGTTTTTCNPFYNDPTNSPCIKCMTSNEGDSTYGPIVTLSNGTARANVAGCIALTDGDSGAGGCGASFQAYDFCPDDSCSDNCVIDNSSTESSTDSYNAYLKCGNSASLTVCKAFAKPTCANDPSYAHCTFVNYESYFVGLGDYFCSNGIISDAGAADSGDD